MRGMRKPSNKSNLTRTWFKRVTRSVRRAFSARRLLREWVRSFSRCINKNALKPALYGFLSGLLLYGTGRMTCFSKSTCTYGVFRRILEDGMGVAAFGAVAIPGIGLTIPLFLWLSSGFKYEQARSFGYDSRDFIRTGGMTLTGLTLAVAVTTFRPHPFNFAIWLLVPIYLFETISLVFVYHMAMTQKWKTRWDRVGGIFLGCASLLAMVAAGDLLYWSIHGIL